MTSNVSATSTTGLYGISSNVSVPNNAQQLLNLLYSNGNVNFSLANSNTQVQANALVAGGGTGTYGNANVAAFLPHYGDLINAGTIFNDSGFAIQGRDYSQMQFTNGVTPPASEYDIGVGSWFYLDAGGGVFQSNTTGTLQTILLGNDATINAGGNITAPYFIGDGSKLTNIPSTSANIQLTGNVTGSGTTGSPINTFISASGVTPGTYGTDVLIPQITVGADGRLTSVITVGISGGGSYGNSNVAAYLASNTDPTISNLNANAAVQATAINVINANVGAFETYANVTFSTQSNAASQQTQINTNTSGLATLNANVGAFETYANATFITSATSYGNTQVAAYLLAPGPIGSVTPNTGAFTTLAGTLSTAAQTNITSVGTLTSLAVGAVTSSGTIIASTVNAGTIGNTGATLTGTLSTAAQTNITSVGTLTALSVTGATTSGNLITTNGVFWPNGVSYSSTSGTYGNTQVAAYLLGNLTLGSTNSTVNSIGNGGAVFAVGSATASGATGASVSLSTTNGLQLDNNTNLKITSGGNITLAGGVADTGYVTVANGVIANSVTSTTGFFWANGVAYSTASASTYGNSNVAAFLNGSAGTINSGIGTTLTVAGNGAQLLFVNGSNPATYTGYTLVATQSNVYVDQGNITSRSVGSAGGYITAANSITTGTGIFWANGVNYSTTVPGTYGNTQVAAYLLAPGPIGSGTPNTGAFTTLAGTLSTAAQTNITSVGTLTSLTTGNVISTNGYFWANGTAYSTGGGSSFTGNLAGSTLYDSVNQRIFANAYPLSTPSTSVVGNFFSNYVNPVPVYTSGVVQAPVSPTGQVNSSGTTVTLAATANIALQSSYQTSNNRTTNGTTLYTQVWATSANTMTSSDRFRGVSTLLDVNMGGKTWTGGSTGSQVVASGSIVNMIGSGNIGAAIGQAGAIIVTPSSATANVLYGSGFFSTISLSGSNTGAVGNVQYARLLSGSVSGFSSNLTVQQAIGLHTPSGWAGTVGTLSSGAQTAYTILNEDAATRIQTNGNLVVTGNTQIKALQETVYATGFTGGAWTANAAQGTIQTATLTSSISSLAFTNMPAGGTVTLIITQGGSGSYTLTTTGIKYAGASSTLSTAVGAIDMLNILFDGTNYYGSLVKGYA